MNVRPLALLGLICAAGQAQAPIDSGTIRIHLLGHAIGSERFAIRINGDTSTLADSFEFTDRGGRVQLTSSLTIGRGGQPLHFKSVGRTYRFVNIDADLDGKQGFYTVAGYAPLEVQALLVRYWNAHTRPHRIPLIPGDSTAIATLEDLGEARLTFSNGTIQARRFSINGVAWGREILYLDEMSRLVAIVTRANLLPLEGLSEDLAAKYPALLDSVPSDATRAE